MLIGYVRVSKSDGSQSVDLQKDSLIEHGVQPDRIYEDLASAVEALLSGTLSDGGSSRDRGFRRDG